MIYNFFKSQSAYSAPPNLSFNVWLQDAAGKKFSVMDQALKQYSSQKKVSRTTPVRM